MASAQKISELTTAGPLTGAELVPIVQNSGTLQTTVSVVAAFAIVSLLPIVSSNTAAITSINAVTSSLEVRVTLLEAALSAIGDVSAIAGVVSAVAVLQTDVAALEIRMTDVSAATSVNAAAISVNSAAITSINAVVSVNAAAITSINAVVSTKANRNGDFLTNVQYIDFNTTTSYAPAPGRLTWDIESGTLDLGLTGTVNLLIGQRTVAQVYNNSGVTLPKGKAVRVTGAQGQRLTGALAQADSDADSLTIFGIMLETVSVNRSGYVATDGLIRNVNTVGYNDGDIVYLSPVSAGELTPTKPVAPQHLVQMGYIVNGGTAGAGEIYVKVQNGYELGELHDVKTSASTSLADGEVLAYNVSAQVWTNSTALIDAQASISALNIQVAAVSALASVNAAAITSINDVVSALEVRVSAVSATGATNSAAITSINNVVSAVQAQVNAVSVSVGQRVLRAGDTMTGVLAVIAGTTAEPGLTFSGDINTGIYSPAADTIAFVEGGIEVMRINSSSNVGIGTTAPVNRLQVNGSFGRGAPVTKTGNFTLADTENWIICNNTAATTTVTFPAASSWTGREVMIKNIAARTVISASSNVVPINSATAGTAILPATAGTWVKLVSDGTNWVIMQS